MKKIISFLLLVSLLFSLSVAAFAAVEEGENLPDNTDANLTAISLMREGPGLPVIANYYSLRMTRDENGNPCDEELGTVPMENVQYYTADQLNLMPEKSRKKFEAQIEKVKGLDPDMVKYMFWIELTGDYAGMVGEQENGAKTELDMWFSDYEGQNLHAEENDHEAPLNDSIKHGNYRLTLQETGTVIITTIGIREVEGVMEVVEEVELEPKMIWVNSPNAGWIVDPQTAGLTSSVSSFVPYFGQEEYEIKLVVAVDSTVEEDEHIVDVPTDDMFIFSMQQIDALPEEAQKEFVEAYEKLRDDPDHIVEYFFYIDLADQYREQVGLQPDGSVQYLLLSFAGDKKDYSSTVNGHDMETTKAQNDDMTYFIKLSELGPLGIQYPADQADE